MSGDYQRSREAHVRVKPSVDTCAPVGHLCTCHGSRVLTFVGCKLSKNILGWRICIRLKFELMFQFKIPVRYDNKCSKQEFLDDVHV